MTFHSHSRGNPPIEHPVYQHSHNRGSMPTFSWPIRGWFEYCYRMKQLTEVKEDLKKKDEMDERT